MLSRAVRGCTSDSSKVSPSHDQLLERAVGTCPVVEIKIGGVVASCLLDTGSQVSIISEGFFFLAGRMEICSLHLVGSS